MRRDYKRASRHRIGMCARPQAPEGEEFVLRDGTRLRGIDDLAHAIAKMTDEEFSRFADAQKNDFARWIERSLDDRFLAATVRRATTRAQLRRALFVARFM